MTRATTQAPRLLRIYLIKPSKYDDAGRVMSFRRGILPSNTLTVLNALVLDWNLHRPADLATRTETVLWDEVVHGAVGPAFLERMRAETRAPGSRAVAFLCGAQTNNYFRARDIALALRGAGIPTLMGGFHVSGHEPSRRYLEAQGVTTVVGEAEGQIGRILEDLARDRLQPSYQLSTGIRAKTGKDPIWVPTIEDAPLPRIDREYLGRFMNPTMTTLDTSRGCPFTCSYCSVKNVMGRTMRSRDPQRVKEWAREAYDEYGIRFLFLVDDDFYRNPRWEEILDGFIELRQGGRPFGFMMQVDVEASGGLARAGGERVEEARRFVEKSAAAGCYQVFVGFESLDPANLEAASKNQNKSVRLAGSGEAARAQVIDGYRKVVTNWHRVGVSVHGAGMIGFPWDGPDAGRRTAQDFIDIGIDQASFFVVTPLPGTEDWDQALAEGRVFDFDFDHYETTRPVMHHPRMTSAQLEAAYNDATHTFYHPKRLLRYVLTRGGNPALSAAARENNVRQFLWYFFSSLRDRHPMIGGFWRRGGGLFKRRMAPVRPAATAAPPPALERLSTEIRRWCDGAGHALREGLPRAAQDLEQALRGAIRHLERQGVVEDDTGVRPLAQLRLRLEGLERDLKELAQGAEQWSRARAASLHVRLTVRLRLLRDDLLEGGSLPLEPIPLVLPVRSEPPY